MRMTQDQRALAHCGLRVMAAKDGRGLWRPRAECTAALITHGTAPALAQACAEAMVRVAVHVRDLAGRHAAR